MNRKTAVLMIFTIVIITAVTLSAVSANPSELTTFKSDSGYEWQIETNMWEMMKDQASDNYDKMKRIGSIQPGYSNPIDVNVTKDGRTWQGIALAVKNDRGMRCEIRGVLPDGQRIMVYETSKA